VLERDENLRKEIFTISRQQRNILYGHQSFAVWMTGLSGSGKSTLANLLQEALFKSSIHCFVLDGDNTRMHLNKDLDFSREGRKENIRRIAEVAALFVQAGIIPIVSFISPFQEDRQTAREIIGSDFFHEVYINASLSNCESRDTKGLYQLARSGKIQDFTGVSSPYEIPTAADLILETGTQSERQCLDILYQFVLDKARI
jgi:adenylylsulfate kinase